MQLDHFSHVLIGGDQLTAARICGAQRVRGNSDNGRDRLEGLVPVVEDWHAKVCFLQVRICVWVDNIMKYYDVILYKKISHLRAKPLSHITVYLPVGCVDETFRDKFQYGRWNTLPIT